MITLFGGDKIYAVADGSLRYLLFGTDNNLGYGVTPIGGGIINNIAHIACERVQPTGADLGKTIFEVQLINNSDSEITNVKLYMNNVVGSSLIYSLSSILGYETVSIKDIDVQQTSSRMLMYKNYTAGAAVSANVVVMIQDGAVYPFDYTDASSVGKAMGFSVTASAIGGGVLVQMGGEMIQDGWGLTANQTYFAGTGGNITFTAPNGVVQKVGYATDANTLLIKMGEPIIDTI